MPRGSEELTNARKEEIIDAFEKLFQTMSFRDISMREIGELTSMTRSSIYNYFQTKEEIHLALNVREYSKWRDVLAKIASHDTMTAEEFAEAIATSLEERRYFLKLISWNNHEIEENCRLERLAEIQSVTLDAIKNFSACLYQFFPDLSNNRKQGFILDFFTYLYGIDSFINVSEKQQSAHGMAGITYHKISVHDAVYGFIMRYLKQEDIL